MTADGQAIADSMFEIGLQEQIIKAQLIYFSYFESGQIVDFSGYAELFRNEDNEILISDINNFYGLEISYEDFMRSYVMVMNTTINEYMFTDSDTKNCADKRSWKRKIFMILLKPLTVSAGFQNISWTGIYLIQATSDR